MIDKLKQIKPTIFAGVPRVWEKIKERIEKHVDNSLFFSADVKAQLGLDECRLPIVSGAPSSITMLQWFYDHNMPLYEIYGLSETAGPITISQPGEYRLGSVGKPLPGIKIKILSDQNQSNLPNLEGEILVKGNCVFSGYLNKPEDTDKAFCDNSGVSVEGNRSWFRTGDIGYYDNEGFLFITGRIKEILITAGGEKVAPELLEEKIKEELPIVSDAMIVGDRQKFLSAVIALKVKFIDGKPTNQLHESAVQALEKIGVFAPTVEDAVNDERVIYYIQAGIDRVNKSRQSWYERIQKWTVVGGEFTVYSGELTPTLKLKREFVYNKYKKEIRDMYS